MTTSTPWLAGAALATALAMASAPATAADATAYMSTVKGQFGTVDLDTGAFTARGSFGDSIAGFGVIGNGVLYGSSYHQVGQLYTIDPTDGDKTAVGAGLDFQIDDFGSTTTHLYALDRGANLYSIDPGTGAAHMIGSTGLTFGSWRALSTDGTSLYFANGSDLYTLDIGTAKATLVGGTGGAEVGAMAFIGGQLYGGANSPTQNVATIDAATGAVSVGAALTGTSLPYFYALAPMAPAAPASPVPEPAAALLLLAGLPLLCRRRQS